MPLWEPSCRLPVRLGLHAVATAKTASTSIKGAGGLGHLLGSGATHTNDPNDARSVAIAALRSAACPPRVGECHAGGADHAHGRAGRVAGGGLLPRAGHHRGVALVAVGAPGRVARRADEAQGQGVTVRGDRGQPVDPWRVPARARDRAVPGQDDQRAARHGDLADRPAQPSHHETPGRHAGQPPAGTDGHHTRLGAGHGELTARAGTAARALRGQFGERRPGGQHRQPQRGAVGPADQAWQRPGGQRPGQPEVPRPERVLLTLAAEARVGRYRGEVRRVQQEKAGPPESSGPRPVPLGRHLPGAGDEDGRPVLTRNRPGGVGGGRRRRAL